MAKFALGTLVVFIASALWLVFAWTNGNRTLGWTPTTAQILKNDVQQGYRGRPAGWLTTIAYQFDGTNYEAVVDDYLIGKEATVYVDPADPRKVVGKAGARVQDLGRPIIATVGSGLFAFVLLLIAYSPKEE